MFRHLHSHKHAHTHAHTHTHALVRGSPSPSPSPSPPSNKGCLMTGSNQKLGLATWCNNPNIKPNQKSGATWTIPPSWESGWEQECTDNGGSVTPVSSMIKLCGSKFPGNNLYVYPGNPGGGYTLSCCPSA